MFKKIRSNFITISLLSSLALIASPSFGDSAAHLSFKGRQLDVKSFLTRLPFNFQYSGFGGDEKKLFFLKMSAGEDHADRLLMLDLKWSDRAVNLDDAVPVSKIDFSKRNLWGKIRYNSVTRKIYFMADEKNEEITKIFEFSPETGEVKAISKTSYVYGWEFSPDQRQLAYFGYEGQAELSPGSVRVIDLETSVEKIVYRDEAQTRLAWGDLLWHPRQKDLIVPVATEQKREKMNWLHLKLDSSEKPKLLLPIETPREGNVVPAWLDDQTFLLASTENEFARIYRLSLNGDFARISPPETMVEGVETVEIKGVRYLVILSKQPLKSVIELIDIASGAQKQRIETSDNIEFLGTDENHLLVKRYSITKPFEISKISWSQDSYQEQVLSGLSPGDQEQVVQCEVEKVSFATFDGLSAPGEDGKLHAFLLKPKRPRPAAEQLVLVKAFYGGENIYSLHDHLLCAAGVTTLSPSSRGSWLFGKEFQKQIIGDLGGKEILDIFAAAKFIQERLNIPNERIGAFGFSHGGYATMRLLTFPGEVDGNHEDFKWGFGIANFGISDIIRHYQTSNIPGWTEQLLGGDPLANVDKWRTRSGEPCAEYLHGPLLLTHGEVDRRVPPEESRAMYRKLSDLGKPVRYVEIPGEGHGYKTIEGLERYYSGVFEFLGSLLNN